MVCASCSIAETKQKQDSSREQLACGFMEDVREQQMNPDRSELSALILLKLFHLSVQLHHKPNGRDKGTALHDLIM